MSPAKWIPYTRIASTVSKWRSEEDAQMPGRLYEGGKIGGKHYFAAG